MQFDTHILVVDDHAEIRELVSSHLNQQGFQVSTAANGQQLRRILRRHRIDLVVLDLMLPAEDGLAICRDLRAASDISILILSARTEEFDRVLGLEMGADDYMVKPFSSRELVARIKAILRRTRALPRERRTTGIKSQKFGRWTLDLSARNLRSDSGLVVPLSTAEFKLLRVLIERPNTVLSRNQLLDLTRGSGVEIFDRSIDTRISRLRQKIEIDPGNPEFIKTIWGGGYLFTTEVTSA